MEHVIQFARGIMRPKYVTAPSELDVVEFARVKLAFEPDEKQCEVLRSGSKRGILNCTRQWGKTTVSAAKAVHRVYTQPGSTVVVASPGARQSGEWMKRAAEMLARLDIRKRGDGYNQLSLALPNGSRIVGLPEVEDKIRGFSSLSMLMIDEASRVSDEMYHALLPMLAVSDGDLWMMSTPFGKRGFFYETWERGDARWHRVRVQATDCPRISKEFLEDQRTQMGGQMFGQEYLCEFLGSGLNAFDRDLVESALDEYLEPLDPAALAKASKGPPNFLASRIEDHFFVGVDLGKKQDFSTLAIVERDREKLLVRGAERIALGTPYPKVVETVRNVVRSPRLWGKCTVVVDGSGVGEPVLDMLRRADLGCNVNSVVITTGAMAREGKSAGATNVPKRDLMAGLQVALETERLRIAKGMKEAGSLVRELLDIRLNAHGGMGAEGANRHDDLVMAVALACWRAKKGFNSWGGGMLV